MRRSVAISVNDQTSEALRWSVAARDRSRPHLQRKLYHFAMGLFCFGLYAFVLTRLQALAILGTIGGVWVFLDVLRLRVPAVNNAALGLFGKLMRREELQSISGNSFYILGMFFVVLCFPKSVALLSILYLAVGDPTAAVVGTHYGRHRFWSNKSIEGVAANFIACAFVSALFAFFYLGFSWQSTMSLAVLGGLIACLAESCPFQIDDNFLIPTLSALMFALAAYLFTMPVALALF